MFIKELWRYPVKSMAGEQLNASEVGKLGVAGDRKVLVLGPNGRVITSRTHPKLLGLKGTLGADGEARISGYGWNTPEALALVRAAAGPAAEIHFYEGPGRFDACHSWWQPTAPSPLLATTDAGLDQTSSWAASKDWPSALGRANVCGSERP